MVNERNQKLSLPITTRQQQKITEKEGETKEIVQSHFKPAQSSVIMRVEASVVVPWALLQFSRENRKALSTKPELSSNTAEHESFSWGKRMTGV